MIYLDYAATSPLRKEVLAEMMPYLTDAFGNPDSLHAFGRRAAQALRTARDTVAETLGVQPSEVCFTSGGTEADNWAVRGAAGAGGVCVSAIEHHAVLEAARLLSLPVTFAPADADGIVTPEALAQAMGSARLAGVMAVNNETGCVQPVQALAETAHARGALFFSDCVQAACACDLKELVRCCDLVSLSAHKAGGPKGVGALIVKRGVKLSPLIAGGEQERGLRGGTSNVAGAVGFACALQLAQREREAFVRHTGSVRTLFEQYVSEALGKEVRADGARRVPNISHLTFARGGTAFLDLLDLAGVACSGGAACSAHSAKPSHVLMAMGRSEEEAFRGVRFSFGMQTTEADALRAAEIVAESYRKFTQK